VDVASTPRTVAHVLEQYLYQEDVQELCDDLGLPVGGTKEDMIARLLSEPEFDPDDTLQYLDEKAIVELCEEWDLDTSGNRDHLLDLVSEAMAPAKPPTPDTGAPVPLPEPLIDPTGPAFQPPPPPPAGSGR